MTRSNARRFDLQALRPLHGFTLVELLVVITIIGILIALLLPAVQAAREAARRMQCSNSLKQMALACLSHESAHGFLPSNGWGYYWFADPDRGVGKDQPGSWGYNILPYLELQAMHDIGRGLTFDEKKEAFVQRELTPIAMFSCPSRRTSAPVPCGYGVFSGWPAWQGVNMNAPGQLSHSDYAINAGDYDPGGGTCEAGPGPSSVNAIDSYAWWDMSKVTGVSFQRSEITIAEISDGTSNTYLIGEKYLDADYYMTGECYGDNEGMFDGFGNNNSRCCNLTPMQDRPGTMDYCRFGSAHSGGLNMSFCDGSVRVINYQIAPDVHACLGNAKDGRSIDGSSF